MELAATLGWLAILSLGLNLLCGAVFFVLKVTGVRIHYEASMPLLFLSGLGLGFACLFAGLFVLLALTYEDVMSVEFLTSVLLGLGIGFLSVLLSLYNTRVHNLQAKKETKWGGLIPQSLALIAQS